MEKKQKYLIGNIKMHLLSRQERKEYVQGVKEYAFLHEALSVILCPPALHIEYFRAHMLQEIDLGIQNISWENKGAYTGENSLLAAKDFGVHYALVGHSERKKYFCENYEDIAKKVSLCRENSVIPILCVGETAEARRLKDTKKVIEEQLFFALRNTETLGDMCIAYEPVWSIGTGETPSVTEIIYVREMIVSWLEKQFGKAVSESVPILYGGSVNKENVKKTCNETGMDGGLIGGASLNPEEFFALGRAMVE